MTGDYQFHLENYLEENHSQLKLVSYEPHSTFPHEYSCQFSNLKDVDGPVDPDDFLGLSKMVDFTSEDYFDACATMDAYRITSQRGKRRQHAYQLAANYRGQPVYHFDNWLDVSEQDHLRDLLDLLHAFSHGVRVTFKEDNQAWYQLDSDILDMVDGKLKSIHARTNQVSHVSTLDIPKVPEFGYSMHHPYPKRNALLSPNDWEILAAAFVRDAETFVQTCIILGFDFHEPEEETQELEEEEEPFVPPPDSESVRALRAEAARRRKAREAGRQGSQASSKENTIPAEISEELHEELTEFIKPSSPIPSEVQTRLPEPIQPEQRPHIPDRGLFAPVEPELPNIVPTYRELQVQRVYGAQRAGEATNTGPGTERFNELFRPSRFTQAAETSAVYSSPGVARAAPSVPLSERNSRVQFSLSDYANNSQSISGGAVRIGQAQDSYYPMESHLGYSGRRESKAPSHGEPSDKGPPRRPPLRPSNGEPPEGEPTRRPGFPGGGPPGPPPGSPDGGEPPPGPPRGPPRLPGPPGPPSRGPPRGAPPGDPGGNPPDPAAGGAVVPQGRPNGIIQVGLNKWVNTRETHFDTKLKPEAVPIWNGDENTLGRWLSQLNEIAQRSLSIFEGLGDIAPTRFRDKALSWWYSLQETHRAIVSQNWETLKEEIRAYWMNQAWVERTQRKALRMRYREPGNSQESPSDYYIRKVEILSLVYNFTPSQVMAEVLQKAPRLWSTVLNPRNYATLAEFQTAIKYHEDLLIEFGERYERAIKPAQSGSKAYTYKVDSKPQKKTPYRSSKDKKFRPKQSQNYSIGSTNTPRPSHPKDDSNVSKPKTPADYNARGCIFCGSIMHWDRDCKYNKDKSSRIARAMFVDTDCSQEDILAEFEYEKCYEDHLTLASQSSQDTEDENEGETRKEDSDPLMDDSEESDF